MNITEQLKAIKPGKTYPVYVKVTEPNGMIIEFHLNSFYLSVVGKPICFSGWVVHVGMYCAIHINGSKMPVSQTGDHNNKNFARGLKSDIKKALARSATVEIGNVRDCQLSI